MWVKVSSSSRQRYPARDSQFTECNNLQRHTKYKQVGFKHPASSTALTLLNVSWGLFRAAGANVKEDVKEESASWDIAQEILGLSLEEAAREAEGRGVKRLLTNTTPPPASTRCSEPGRQENPENLHFKQISTNEYVINKNMQYL